MWEKLERGGSSIDDQPEERKYVQNRYEGLFYCKTWTKHWELSILVEKEYQK